MDDDHQFLNVPSQDEIVLEFESKDRILIVDDEPFNIQGMMIIINACLKAMGHDEELLNKFIDYASNGQQAVQCV